MFPFISPFFPNIVTSYYYYYYFKVRVRTISIMNAHLRVGCNRVAIASYVKHQGGRSRGESNVVTLVAIAHAPPPFLSLPHTSGWTSERGVQAMIVTHAVVACAPPLVTSRKQRYVFIVTWDFWDFVKNIIFFNIV